VYLKKNLASLLSARLLNKLIASKLALFSVSGLRDDKLIIKQIYMKTETCQLYSFEYFCQMSSKSIIVILSHTVSKLVHFLRHGKLVFYRSMLCVV